MADTCRELTQLSSQAYVHQRCQPSASFDISRTLEGCGPRTIQHTVQLLKPVICSMPISANLYVGFRAHSAQPSSSNNSKSSPLPRAAIVSTLMRIAGCHLKWNKSTATDRFTPYRTVATFVRATFRVHTDQRRPPRFRIHRNPPDARYYRQMGRFN